MCGNLVIWQHRAMTQGHENIAETGGEHGSNCYSVTESLATTLKVEERHDAHLNPEVHDSGSRRLS